ncbi:MAG: oligosaccharide flippase family protein [Bacteroidetes bacterium]|jgi:PST family polysaccharide transporter|nr:oligosaccharide flippase family protein [Bacteroidota bacterium]
MNDVIKRGVSVLNNNKKVMENYFFMTALQVLNSLFYLIIYPFLIRTLSADSYGLYVFALSITNYFITLVSFGFDLPAAKAIAQNPDNKTIKSNTLSAVFTAKIYLEIISLVIFSILVFTIPTLTRNWLVLFIIFAQTAINIFLPQWYFQGIQNMRIVTYIQLAFKLLSLPFIFIFVHHSADLIIFAIISSVSGILGAFTATYIIVYKHKIALTFKPVREIKIWIKDSFPFFSTYALTAIKQQSISVIIGAFFSMSEVALYDLGYKIFSIPQVLFSNINGALFPKIAINAKKENIKKIFLFETLAGFSVVLFVAIFGKFIVLFLGGETMLGAYPIAIILSFGALTSLLVSGYISFIFVPNNKYYFVIKNQIFSFIAFCIIIVIGLLSWKSIITIAIAWTLSGLLEILYCKILIKKHKLM